MAPIKWILTNQGRWRNLQFIVSGRQLSEVNANFGIQVGGFNKICSVFGEKPVNHLFQRKTNVRGSKNVPR